MTLDQLLDIIDLSHFDFADDEYDATFYATPVPEICKKIDVVKITNKYIICDFSKFMRENKDLIINYIDKNYYDDYKQQYIDAMNDEENYPITWCDFIENSLMYILQGEDDE